MPFRRLIVVVLGLAAGFAPAVADGRAAAPDTEQRLSELESTLEELQLERAIEQGKKIYARACAACHGSDGQGAGPAAADLDPRPRDLTSRQFRFRTTASGEPPTPEDLERTIRRGLPGTSMPAFDELFSTPEMDDLVRFVQSLQPTGQADEPPSPVAVPTVPQPDAGTIEQGRAIYLTSGCWRCHAVTGSGRGPSARGLTDENDVPIRTTDLRYDPFKGGRDPQAVVRTLLTGLNGAPMPSYAEAMLFAREDVQDTSALDGVLADRVRLELEEYLRTVPSREDLERLDEQSRTVLRDRRLIALAYYVLSFDRREGFWYRLLRERPELEARR